MNLPTPICFGSSCSPQNLKKRGNQTYIREGGERHWMKPFLSYQISWVDAIVPNFWTMNSGMTLWPVIPSCRINVFLPSLWILDPYPCFFEFFQSAQYEIINYGTDTLLQKSFHPAIFFLKIHSTNSILVLVTQKNVFVLSLN